MRLELKDIIHIPDGKKSFDYQMDLSDLEFGGSCPVTRPVVVDGQLRNQAGVLLCELQITNTLHCVCDRCAQEFDREKSVDYACVLAEERQSDEDDDIVLLDNDEVDVTELARDAFILDMDTKFLCSEDCKGL